MAMDQARVRRDLSISKLFPSIAARFAKSGPGSFCVLPGRERERSAASHRLAFDSAANADPRLSISAMFPEIAARLKLG